LGDFKKKSFRGSKRSQEIEEELGSPRKRGEFRKERGKGTRIGLSHPSRVLDAGDNR